LVMHGELFVSQRLQLKGNSASTRIAIARWGMAGERVDRIACW
jgi:hypothetical protein